jgi:hypothetical protein
VLTPRSFVRTDFPITPEQQRQRELRSARRAAVTNRIRREVEQSAAPTAPAAPRQQVLDPLSSPAEQLVRLQLAQAHDDELSWRQRIDRELQRERELYQRFGSEPPKWIPRRWRELERLGKWPSR